MRFSDLTVCVVGPVAPPAGGMANQAAELRRLLAQENAHTLFVATTPPYWPGWVARIRGLRALCRLLQYVTRLWAQIGKADVVHLMANSGWSWHLYAAPALWIAHFKGVPVVLNYRGGKAEQFFERSWTRVAASLKLASALVVPSPFLAEVFAQRQTEARVIPNTLNHSVFYPPADTDAKTSGKPTFVVARNLEPIYGNDLAIRAFAIVKQQLENAELVIAGSGSELGGLQQLAGELGVGDAVQFCGRLNQQQIAALYRRATVLLNPSRVDNSPNSLIEALACGLPIVSSNAGGIPYLVEHGETALLVEVDDHQGLANAVLELLDNPELSAKLTRAGLAQSQKFHWTRIREELLQTYSDAIQTKTKRAYN